MRTYKTKFGVGDIVEAHGLPGIITAVFIRSGVSYEFSYTCNSEPRSCCCEEVELKLRSERKIGFSKEESNAQENGIL